MKFNSIAQSSLAVLSILLVAAPNQSFAATPSPAPYCIAVNGGFDDSLAGPTYVARNFLMPEANKCSTWAGYTKVPDTVIFITNGVACLSGDSLALTVSVASADPANLGSGSQQNDYIYMTRASKTEAFSGTDQNYYESQPAAPISCSSDILTLPATHD